MKIKPFFSFASTVLLATPVLADGNGKPNIIIIITDQQQAHAFAREGFGLDTSPFRDSIANKGVWFDKAYTSCPECVPARISLITGRFPGTHGVRANPTATSPYITPGVDLVHLLDTTGYVTAMVGKNHTFLRNNSFDYYRDYTGARVEAVSDEEKEFDTWLNNLHHRVELKPTPFPIKCQRPYRIVTESEKWIESLNNKNPFFLSMSFPEPHNPYQVPEPYFSMFPPETLPPVHAGKEILDEKGFVWQFTRALGEKGFPNYEESLPRMRSNYYGMLRLIDDQINRFFSFLEEKGLLKNTLIFIVADHGDFAGEYGLMRKGAGMPEVLIRIPFQVFGYGITQHKGPHPAHVSIVDIFPTICDAINVDIPSGVQGRSLWPILTGKSYPSKEFESIYAEQGYGGPAYSWNDEIDFKYGLRPGVTFDELNRYSQAGLMRMVRKGPWKLIVDQDMRGELYNLQTDPFELINLYESNKYQEVKTEMLECLVKWMLRAVDPLPLPGGDYKQKKLPHNYWTEETHSLN
jgi:arylsulfatase A-like enzyme